MLIKSFIIITIGKYVLALLSLFWFCIVTGWSSIFFLYFLTSNCFLLNLSYSFLLIPYHHFLIALYYHICLFYQLYIVTFYQLCWFHIVVFSQSCFVSFVSFFLASLVQFLFTESKYSLFTDSVSFDYCFLLVPLATNIITSDLPYIATFFQLRIIVFC